MNKDNLFGSGKYVLGIMSIIFAFFNPLSGIILGISALLIEKDEKDNFSLKGKKLARIGMILGAIIFILGILLTKFIFTSVNI